MRVDDQEVSASKLILAPGTAPAMPPILAEVGALDSTTAMELGELPESIVLVCFALMLGIRTRRQGLAWSPTIASYRDCAR